jgi:cytochrome c peroxidase
LARRASSSQPLLSTKRFSQSSASSWEEPSFRRYDSKYDAYLAGKAKLSEAEARGLKLFEDPNKGNCSSCNIDRPSRDGRLPPAYTDYQFEALGAPRNQDIPANSDPNYYDLYAARCGRTMPIRRPIAGSSRRLRCAMWRRGMCSFTTASSIRSGRLFYVERETNPAKWYPRRMARSIATMTFPLGKSKSLTSTRRSTARKVMNQRSTMRKSLT